VVWTQWFERARFEAHPGNRPPYDVLLGRLGDDRLQQQGRSWFSAFKPGQSRPGCLWFATKHGICDELPAGESIGFQTHFRQYGLDDPALDAVANSVALFGLPLSEPQMELNASGDTVLTQWFERGRFEWHPNQPPTARVLLGLLGSEVLKHRQRQVMTVTGAISQDLSATTTGLQVAYQATAPARLHAVVQQPDGRLLASTDAVAVAPGQSTTTLTLAWKDATTKAAGMAIQVCLTAAAGSAEACLIVPPQPPWAIGSPFVSPASPFRGLCRISRPGFRALLQRHAAPAVLAERDAGEYWDAIRAHRIDPLFIAAIFAHESQMGRVGVATQTHSWGNTRAPSFGAQPVGEVPGRSGHFPVFATWLDGAVSTAARLNAPDWVYAGRHSISEVFIHPSGQVWAPAGDHNNPRGYLRTVLDFINRYQEPTSGACRG
jgi:hypothetical protein